ncbi:MAG: hypothetical protein H0T42_16565 [Deltaproteobacteria bacterium]|nr:hypothetical protein [Deltaproteobacteria bacterium]
MTYRDGVDYSLCLRCDAEVDWIDGRSPVWVCQPCGTLVNEVVEEPMCGSCETPMHLLAVPAEASSVGSPPSVRRMAGYTFVSFLVVQTLFALVDPDAFPYLAPILAILQLLGLVIVAGIVVLSRPILALVDHRTRILHGLEHATIAVLGERGIHVRSGVTKTGEFHLVLNHDGRLWQRSAAIRLAARDAIGRVMSGEHALAYTPYCGTSYVIAICLYAIAVVAAGIVASVLGAPLGITWAATVAAGLCARAIARPSGLAMQRWLTVSTDIASARVTDMQCSPSSDGDRLLVVVAVEVTPRAREGGLVAI